MPEFERWKASTDNHHTWKIKYYKGLGTSTAKEAKEYFSDMERHRIPFEYGGAEDDDSIVLVSRWCLMSAPPTSYIELMNTVNTCEGRGGIVRVHM